MKRKSINAKRSPEDDRKAEECMKYLKDYCHRFCSCCTFRNKYSCPSMKGDRCPAMWEV